MYDMMGMLGPFVGGGICDPTITCSSSSLMRRDDRGSITLSHDV